MSRSKPEQVSQAEIPQGALAEVVILGFSEFANGLTGTDSLLAMAMRLEFADRKLSLTDWNKHLKEFGTREVK